METEVGFLLEQPGVAPGTAVVAIVKRGRVLLLTAGEAPPSVDRDVDKEVDDLPVPAPRVPKAHKAYGKGSKTSRGRGISDQPRRNVQLLLGY